MSRLEKERKQALNSIYHNTKSYNNGEDNYNYLTISDALDKLSQLEDIEEELGIDLITLFKAMKNGFYDKHFHYGSAVINNGYICYYFDESGIRYKLKDYGKTWALTKEELE